MPNTDHSPAEEAGEGPAIEEMGGAEPLPARIPRPTIWPLALALGVVVGVWGLVTQYLLIIFGAALSLLSLAGWIRELVLETTDPS